MLNGVCLLWIKRQMQYEYDYKICRWIVRLTWFFRSACYWIYSSYDLLMEKQVFNTTFLFFNSCWSFNSREILPMNLTPSHFNHSIDIMSTVARFLRGSKFNFLTKNRVILLEYNTVFENDFPSPAVSIHLWIPAFSMLLWHVH